MRNPVIYIALLAALGTFGCEQRVDVATEEAAIKAVCQAQLDAFRAFDYEAEAATWVQEPYTVRKTGDSSYIKGWDSLSVYYKNTFEQYKNDPANYNIEEFTASNFDIHLNGNVAFVFYEEHIRGIWNGESVSTDNWVLKYLEKKDGEWKIVAVLPAK